MAFVLGVVVALGFVALFGRVDGPHRWPSSRIQSKKTAPLTAIAIGERFWRQRLRSIGIRLASQFLDAVEKLLEVGLMHRTK